VAVEEADAERDMVVRAVFVVVCKVMGVRVRQVADEDQGGETGGGDDVGQYEQQVGVLPEDSYDADVIRTVPAKGASVGQSETYLYLQPF